MGVCWGDGVWFVERGCVHLLLAPLLVAEPSLLGGSALACVRFIPEYVRTVRARAHTHTHTHTHTLTRQRMRAHAHTCVHLCLCKNHKPKQCPTPTHPRTNPPIPRIHYPHPFTQAPNPREHTSEYDRAENFLQRMVADLQSLPSLFLLPPSPQSSLSPPSRGCQLESECY